jgi:hypothetical protein
MGFPLVIVNVFLVFSIAIAVCCWGFALIPIWRANMKTITCIPVLHEIDEPTSGRSRTRYHVNPRVWGTAR